MYSARLASTGDAMLSLGASLDLAIKAISEGLGIDLTEQDFRILDTAAQVFKHASGDLLRRCKKKKRRLRVSCQVLMGYGVAKTVIPWIAGSFGTIAGAPWPNSKLPLPMFITWQENR